MYSVASVGSNSLLWTIARQTPLSMGFSQQEYWSRLSLPPPGDLSDRGIELLSYASPELQADSLLLSHQGNHIYIYIKKEKEKK